jgi:hypothetical protein
MTGRGVSIGLLNNVPSSIRCTPGARCSRSIFGALTPLPALWRTAPCPRWPRRSERLLRRRPPAQAQQRDHRDHQEQDANNYERYLDEGVDPAGSGSW